MQKTRHYKPSPGQKVCVKRKLKPGKRPTKQKQPKTTISKKSKKIKKAPKPKKKLEPKRKLKKKPCGKKYIFDVSKMMPSN